MGLLDSFDAVDLLDSFEAVDALDIRDSFVLECTVRRIEFVVLRRMDLMSFIMTSVPYNFSMNHLQNAVQHQWHPLQQALYSLSLRLKVK